MLRHSYATWSLAAGVSLFSLARRMGTSVDMIDRTYGHLAPDAESYERELLDAFDAKNEAFRQVSDTENRLEANRARRERPANHSEADARTRTADPSLRVKCSTS